MKIYLPVFSYSASCKTFDLNTEHNPGIGGTQHVTVLLASRLARAKPQWTIYLVNYSPINILNSSQNLKQASFESLEQFCQSLRSPEETDSRAIITALLLERCKLAELKLISNKVFCWLHHPFHFKHKLRQADFLAYINQGSYQHSSNCRFYPRCIIIQNIFSPANKANIESSIEIRQDFPLRLVHLGALVPDKGLLHIAKQWKRLKKAFPNAQLNVIGSALTYNSWDDVHQLVPASPSYANQILKHIPESDITQGHCRFHGNLGLEKDEIITSSHLALQNPTGIRESFGAATFECMALGTPVIASGDYGMHEAMQHFPELAIQRPSQIVGTIQRACSDTNQYKELQCRSIAVAKLFSLNSEAATWKWIRVLQTEKREITADSIIYPGFNSSTLKAITKLNYRRVNGVLRTSIKSATKYCLRKTK